MFQNFNKIKLSRRQIKSLGLKIQQQQKTNDHLLPLLTTFFQQFKYQKSQQKYLQNQTYQQFKQMNLTGPNQDDTGRYSFKQIRKIYFTYIPKKDIPNKQQIITKKVKKSIIKLQKNNKIESNQLSFKYQDSINIIQKILTAFFQIPVEYHNFHLYIDSKSNKIIDEKQMIQFDIQKNAYNCFQVNSLSNLGFEYKQKLQKQKSKKDKKQNIVMFLIQADLIEDEDGNEYEIDGRAFGNGVSFTTYNKDDFKLNNFQQLKKYQFLSYSFPTLIHQCLHTLGFDHCSAWKCLMNSQTNQQFWLCPCCLRKLSSQIDHKIGIKQWYKTNIKIIKDIKKQFQKKFGTEKRIRLLQFLYQNPNPLFNEKPSFKQTKKFITMLEKGQKIIQNIQKLQMNLSKQ